MPRDLLDALIVFTRERKFNRKGPLCVAFVMTQQARVRGLPLNSGTLLTEGGGQVFGLGQSAVQSILERHGITRVLASEGVRRAAAASATCGSMSPFSISCMLRAVPIWTRLKVFGLRESTSLTPRAVQIRLDASRSLRTVVRDVLDQAEERQKTTPGVYYAGAVMQHMVGAKLDCALGPGKFEHNSYSTSDQQSGRSGDFFLGDVAIHVTTSPGEAVIERSPDNLNDGFRPILVTGQRGLNVAEGLADNAGLADRIDVFEVEQFIALNLYELGKFGADGRQDRRLRFCNSL